MRRMQANNECIQEGNRRKDRRKASEELERKPETRKQTRNSVTEKGRKEGRNQPAAFFYIYIQFYVLPRVDKQGGTT